MELIDKEPFTITHHAYTVIDPQLFLDFQDTLLSRPHWNVRIGVKKFDDIEKVAPTLQENGQYVFNCTQYGEIIVIFSPNKDIKVRIEKQSVTIKKNHSVVFPSCFNYIRIILEDSTDHDQLEVRSTPLAEEFRKLFNFTNFTFFWPIFGTNVYAYHIKGHTYFDHVTNATDLIDKFVFKSIKDAPVFKICKRHLKYDIVRFCTLDVYIELSKWKRMDVEENDGPKIYNVTIYSCSDKLEELLQDKTFHNFVPDSNSIRDQTNLTYLPCISFVLKQPDYSNFRRWLFQQYPTLTDVHYRVENLPTNQELSEKITQIKLSAEVDKRMIETAMDLLNKWHTINPIVLIENEDPSTYNWSKEVFDIIFNPQNSENSEILTKNL